MENKAGTPATKAATSVPVPKLKRRGVIGFFTDVKREMKHVTWPKHADTTRQTMIVLATCALAVVILFALSESFALLLKFIIGGGGPTN